MWPKRCCRRRSYPDDDRLLAAAAPGYAFAGAAPLSAHIGRNVLDSCHGFDLLVFGHLEAADLARLSRARRADHDRLTEAVVRWCANTRRASLTSKRVPGDLQLADTRLPPELGHEKGQDGDSAPTWTLERLHLAEHPPRFPRLYFHFATDKLVHVSRSRVVEVVELLRRFPSLRILIEGYGNPSAPPVLGAAVAQARAAAVRYAVLTQLREDPGPRVRAAGPEANPWAAEGSDDGVYSADGCSGCGGGYDEGRGRENVEFYEPRLLGRHLLAIGRWGQDPNLRNANFLPEEIAADWDIEAKFRRVDFTVLCKM